MDFFAHKLPTVFHGCHRATHKIWTLLFAVEKVYEVVFLHHQIGFSVQFCFLQPNGYLLLSYDYGVKGF